MDGRTGGNRTDIIISTSNKAHAQDCGISQTATSILTSKTNQMKASY